MSDTNNAKWSVDIHGWLHGPCGVAGGWFHDRYNTKMLAILNAHDELVAACRAADELLADVVTITKGDASSIIAGQDGIRSVCEQIRHALRLAEPTAQTPE